MPDDLVVIVEDAPHDDDPEYENRVWSKALIVTLDEDGKHVTFTPRDQDDE